MTNLPEKVIHITSIDNLLYAVTSSGRLFVLRGGRWEELATLPLFDPPQPKRVA